MVVEASALDNGMRVTGIRQCIFSFDVETADIPNKPLARIVQITTIEFSGNGVVYTGEPSPGQQPRNVSGSWDQCRNGDKSSSDARNHGGDGVCDAGVTDNSLL